MIANTSFVFLVILATVSSFTPSLNNNRLFGYSTTKLQSRTDSADAVEAALAASKKYGATSKEARLAWEEVEEMDSSDNSIAYSGGDPSEECYNNPNSPKCKEYEEKMQALGALLEENKAKIYAMKTLAQEVQNMKVPVPGSVSTDEDQSESVNVALIQELIAGAKEASSKFGADSNEAKLAWENVEEVSSADSNYIATQPTLEEICIVEAVEACAALEELGRVITLTRSESTGLNS